MRRVRPWRRRFGRRFGQRSWASWRGAAKQLRGPLYAVVDAGTAYEGGFGHSRDGRRVSVALDVRHVRPGAEVEVRSSDEPVWGSGDFDEWRLVSDWTHRAARPEAITFPLVLRADRWERDVLVDGVPVPFVFVGGDDVWCAAGRPGGRDVTLSGTGWPHEGIALATVDVGQVSGQVPDPA